MNAPGKRTPAGGPGRVGKASCGWEVYRDTPIDALLARLERVKQTGPGQWIARCPAHQDKSPSMSVKQCDDGTVLLHDFAGCSPADILAAVGLELRDLFPAPVKDQTPEGRRRARQAFKQGAWAAALTVLNREAYVVEIAAHDVAEGKVLAAEDHERLLVACQRVHDAREALR